jgi:sterol desaturase/sphingolipid hydroxylase (fatty acid hydroxylase superfamily)
MWKNFKNLLGIRAGSTRYEKIFFRVSHPMGPTLLFLFFAAALVGWAQAARAYPLPLILILLTGGLLLWTLIEYVLHRFVFHWTAKDEPWRSIASGLHLAHHRNPDDRSLVIAPPVFSILNSMLIFGLLALVTWSLPAAAVLLAGIQVGYIAYEWVHYGAHQYQPHSKGALFLKHYHLGHHFRHPDAGFGVTTPIWDKIFRTSRP